MATLGIDKAMLKGSAHAGSARPKRSSTLDEHKVVIERHFRPASVPVSSVILFIVISICLITNM